MNKYYILRAFLLLIISVIYTSSIFSQQDTSMYSTFDYGQKRTFNIGGIEVDGAKSRDPNAIKSIAKLREGRQITIPGDAVPNAIKALLRLGLFEDVQIMQEDIKGDLIFLKIVLIDRPTLSRYSIVGEAKNKHGDLTDIIDKTVSKGSIVTEDLKNLLILKLEESYIEKGFLDAEVTIDEKNDKVKDNAVRLIFNIEKNKRVKIANISILGNSKVSDAKLKKKLSDTKQAGTLFKKSKFVKEDYEADKKNLLQFYNSTGYRDAVVVEDTMWRSFNGDLNLEMTIDEGEQYYFRNITWKGNSKYNDKYLTAILGIAKGDVYDPELLEKRLSFSLDGRDISSLYLDDGYLFFNVDPVEISVQNDSIDLEMQMYEGAQATIANVNIYGNDRTHEHVIRRELRTNPGDKFSRTNIIRSNRSVSNLGYFNPELDIQTPVNQANGTVDINYTVEERPSDQLELSAGYGGQSNGLIGTLGITFNNFSLGNIKDKSTWSPLPQGDGQKLSVRAQSNGRFFRSYNASFTEPWLGGKRPTSLSVGVVHSSFDQTFFDAGSLNITRGFVGLGTQLKWPDDFFSANLTLSIENIRANDFAGFFTENPDNPDGDPIEIEQGNFKNFSLNATISRSSVSEPIYPRRGSRVSLSVQFTPPYSIFRSNDTRSLSASEAAAEINEEIKIRGSNDPFATDAALQAEHIENIELANKFEFLEYHKWRFNAEWYFNIFSKFVISTNIKTGFLGNYNSSIGTSPFERFEVGGDGLSNQNAGITGKDIISLRGYETLDLPDNGRGGGTIFNKFTMELRYPLSLNPSSSIYLHSFVQGGNIWTNFNEFSPFDLKRSAGFGVRVFLPMFGLLGFDYGWGFDKDPNANGFGGFGQFNIVLGFEPE